MGYKEWVDAVEKLLDSCQWGPLTELRVTQNTQLKKRIYQIIIFFILDFIAKVVEKVCKCVKDTLYGILKQEEQTEKKHTEEQKSRG